MRPISFVSIVKKTVRKPKVAKETKVESKNLGTVMKSSLPLSVADIRCQKTSI